MSPLTIFLVSEIAERATDGAALHGDAANVLMWGDDAGEHPGAATADGDAAVAGFGLFCSSAQCGVHGAALADELFDNSLCNTESLAVRETTKSRCAVVLQSCG